MSRTSKHDQFSSTPLSRLYHHLDSFKAHSVSLRDETLSFRYHNIFRRPLFAPCIAASTLRHVSRRSATTAAYQAVKCPRRIHKLRSATVWSITNYTHAPRWKSTEHSATRVSPDSSHRFYLDQLFYMLRHRALLPYSLRARGSLVASICIFGLYTGTLAARGQPCLLSVILLAAYRVAG